MVPVLTAISLITFGLMHLAPGGPWDGSDVRQKRLPPAVIANLNRKFNLDRPLWEQYASYIWDSLHGDLGPSYQYPDHAVSELLFAPSPDHPLWESRFLRSATMGLLAFLLMMSVSIPLGIVAALKRNSWVDRFLLLLCSTGIAVPSFVLAVFLIVIFGFWLHWVPIAASNWSDPKAWVLPVCVLALGGTAFLTRLTRSTLLETLRQDYIRTARAKGLRERAVILRHALRNGMIPLATVAGPALAGLMTGSFFIEQMFSFPGMGRFFVQSVNARDYSMIMGTTLFYALLIGLANLGVDLAYGWLDPRINVSG
jgi:oligopeptide transport system permease protein